MEQMFSVLMTLLLIKEGPISQRPLKRRHPLPRMVWPGSWNNFPRDLGGGGVLSSLLASNPAWFPGSRIWGWAGCHVRGWEDAETG